MTASAAPLHICAYWKNALPTEGPFLHPEDKDRLGRGARMYPTPAARPLNAPFLTRDIGFHTYLLPVPYLGDMRDLAGKVVVALLNPGFGEGDPRAEQTSDQFRCALRATLDQENLDPDYPFVFLNPRFAWTGGFQWWHARLDHVMRVAAKYLDEPAGVIARRLARILVAVELCPYHSRNFSANGHVLNLPSVSAMASFVTNSLPPLLARGSTRLVFGRSEGKWFGVNASHGTTAANDIRKFRLDNADLEKRSLVAFQEGPGRSVTFGPTTKAGRILLELLGVQYDKISNRDLKSAPAYEEELGRRRKGHAIHPTPIATAS